MARTVHCDQDDGEQALFLVSNLDDGSALAMCRNCFASWVVALADSIGTHSPNGAAEAALVDAEAPQEVEAAPKPPRPKRGRRAPQSFEEAVSAPESPFRDPPSDDS